LQRSWLPAEAAEKAHLDIVVGGVMPDVAMDQPLAWVERFPYHVIGLARSDVDGFG
jgi:hypothetical protein